MSTAEERWDRLTQQFETAPATGLNRYWMSVITWSEDWPEDAPFFSWQTGNGSDMRLKPSVAGSPEAEGLPARTNGDLNESFPPATMKLYEDDQDAFYEFLDRMYVSSGMICMLVDAVDEDAAWAIVKEQYPDMVQRFIEPAPDYTLTMLAEGGRFRHPNPPVAEAAPSP